MSARRNLTPPLFIALYRDALFAAGWKLIDVTKLDETRAAAGNADGRRRTT